MKLNMEYRGATARIRIEPSLISINQLALAPALALVLALARALETRSPHTSLEVLASPSRHSMLLQATARRRGKERKGEERKGKERRKSTCVQTSVSNMASEHLFFALSSHSCRKLMHLARDSASSFASSERARDQASKQAREEASKRGRKQEREKARERERDSGTAFRNRTILAAIAKCIKSKLTLLHDHIFQRAKGQPPADGLE